MMHESLMLPRRYLGRLCRRIDIERIVNELRWSLDLPREWSGRLRRSLGLMAVPSHALNCAVAYNKYGGYCIPASTFRHRLSRKILAGQVWEQTTLEFMRAHCGDGDIVTAGTFFGDFLPALSPALRPGATLWAFEPHPESYRCATITIMLNDLKNVKLTNAALRKNYGTSNLVVARKAG